VGVNWPYGCVISWVDTGVAGFTKKSGVFFAYGVDGPEFFPALYVTLRIREASVRVLLILNLNFHEHNSTARSSRSKLPATRANRSLD